MGKTPHYHIWKKRNGHGLYTSCLFLPLHFLGCLALEELQAIQHFMYTFQHPLAPWKPCPAHLRLPSQPSLWSPQRFLCAQSAASQTLTSPISYPILSADLFSTFSYHGQNQPFPTSQSSHFDTGPLLEGTSQLALLGEWILKLEKVQITTVCSDSREFCEPNHRLNEMSDFGKIITSYHAIFLVFSMQWIFQSVLEFKLLL